MTLRWYAGPKSDALVYNPNTGLPVVGDTGTVWLDKAATLAATGLVDGVEAPIGSNTVTADAYGYVQLFGIDTDPVVEKVWVDFTGGTGLTIAMECNDRASYRADDADLAITVTSGELIGDDLILTRVNGTVINAGYVKGDPGVDGSNVLPTDTAIANAVNTPASETAVALNGKYAQQVDVYDKTASDGKFEKRTHVTVGTGGDYATLDLGIAAYPAGGVDIELMAGTHTLAAPISATAVPNVTIRGQGREVTTINCAGGFIVARSNCNQWTIRDLKISRNAGTNTDDGIDVDYPRRWSVRGCWLTGFGGSTIHYRGGIHSEIRFNYIAAQDSTNTNGLAGIHIEKSLALVVSTSIITEANYVGAGVQYGILVKNSNFGSVFTGDVAEACAVGMRFEVAFGEIHSPYTEANTVGIEMHDSLMIVSNPREIPVLTWAVQASSDRRPLFIGRNYINPGKAIIFGNTTGAVVDPALAPSIRWGTGSPESVYTAVVGSTYHRTDGGAGTTFYVKESGTGNVGWIAK